MKNEIRCGWCPYTPYCIDKKDYYECPKCKRIYQKPEKRKYEKKLVEKL